MGIITNLIRANHEKKLQDINQQLEGYKLILQVGSASPELVKPETLEWAIDNIAALGEGKKPGSKSGGKDSPFKVILKGLTQLNPAPGAPKPVGQRPEQMFRSPAEQETYLKQQEERKAEGIGMEEKARETAKGAADVKTDQALFEQKSRQRKETLDHRLKAIEEGPFKDDEKQRFIQLAWNDFVTLGKAPMRPTSAVEKRAQLVRDYVELGKTPEEAERLVAAGETATKPGSVARDKEDIALKAFAEKHGIKVEDMTAAQKQEALQTGSELKGELANRAEAQKIVDEPSGYTPSQIKAAKDYLKSLDTREKGAEIRVITAGQNAAENQAVRALDAQGPTGPEAKKLRARAAMDPAMDLAAWDWLAYEKFDVRGLGKTTQADVARIKMRAGQIMDDLGLSTGDIFAMRSGLKGNTAALSKITTTGAQIEQFEDTLQRNVAVARDLSDRFKRSDVKLVNRVIGAFKTGTGDSEALNLAAQLHGVSREWSKIMAGSTSAAGVPISEAAQTDELIGAALSKGQLDSLFTNVIEVDAKNRSAAINDTKNHLLQQIRGVTSAPTAQPTTPNAPKSYKYTAGGGKAGSDDGVHWFDTKTGQPWK